MRDNGRYAPSAQTNFYYVELKWYEKLECLPFAVLVVIGWIVILALFS